MSGGESITLKQLIKKVTNLGATLGSKNPWVCITGGEPLVQQKELEKLIRNLKGYGYKITIETNGSIEPPEWFDLIDSWCADIKLPFTQPPGSPYIQTYTDSWLHTRIDKDQIKFVVGNEKDLEFVGKLIKNPTNKLPTILLSPMAGILNKGNNLYTYWDRVWLQRVAEFCKEIGARFSLQIHKAIWGDKTGV